MRSATGLASMRARIRAAVPAGRADEHEAQAWADGGQPLERLDQADDVLAWFDRPNGEHELAVGDAQL